MESVLQVENLRAAYLAVKTNGGAPGIDGMKVEEMKAHIQRHWGSIEAKQREGKYRPAAVRAVEIPKASGGKRRLGIPTVMDRMIQQALNQALTPTFEEGFSESSYGFRPGRSAHDAVRKAHGLVAEGRSWVVDIDLKNFFDQVNHDRLMNMVGSKVRDKRVLRLIGDYLRACPSGRNKRSGREKRGLWDTGIKEISGIDIL
jgi:group II intron reverse transcriptase/maturase